MNWLVVLQLSRDVSLVGLSHEALVLLTSFDRWEVQLCNTLLDHETGQWKETSEGMAFSTWMPEKIEA